MRDAPPTLALPRKGGGKKKRPALSCSLPLEGGGSGSGWGLRRGAGRVRVGRPGDGRESPAPPPMNSTEMIERLLAFDTVSAKSNPPLLHHLRPHLAPPAVPPR